MLYERAQLANTLILVLVKVEAETFSVTNLQEIVVERLLAHTNLGRRVLKTVLDAL